MIEKPFGHDLDSALELNRQVASAFDESQVFRLDHYLGKETVQNLQVLRFANGILEPIWNRRYVEHVQITVAEDLGIGHRAAYYDSAGAIRDVIQNHVMQLLALVAMEAPVRFDADTIRDEKVKLLRSVRRYKPEEVPDYVVRGQYGAGWVGGEEVPAYLDEEGVAADSRTDTYVAMRVEVDNWRWAGTPFYVRTGKRLPRRVTEIAVRFRPAPHLPFASADIGDVEPNEMVLSVQPDEGASLRLVAKVPGQTMSVRPVQMEFKYGTSFLGDSPEAYERLLHDALRGDATLFTRADEVEAEWRIVQPILEAWESRARARRCTRRAARARRRPTSCSPSADEAGGSCESGAGAQPVDGARTFASSERGGRARSPAPRLPGRRARARAGPNPEPDRRARLRGGRERGRGRPRRAGRPQPLANARPAPARRRPARRRAGDRVRAARGGRPGGRLPRPGDADGRRLPPGARGARCWLPCCSATCPRSSGSLSPIRRSPTAACSTAPSRSWSTPPPATAPTFAASAS